MSMQYDAPRQKKIALDEYIQARIDTLTEERAECRAKGSNPAYGRDRVGYDITAMEKGAAIKELKELQVVIKGL